MSEYNTTTGAAINANFITGLNEPVAIAVSGNALFVANFGNQTIGKYNATTGAAINSTFITGLNSPIALAVSGNNLLVANSENGTVGEYDATTGAVINAKLITGLNEPFGLAANAGPNQTVQAGTLVTLDASASSDPTGQLPLTYA